MVSEQARFHSTNPPSRKRRKRSERNMLWWLVWALIAGAFLLPAIAYAAPVVRLMVLY